MLKRKLAIRADAIKEKRNNFEEDATLLNDESSVIKTSTLFVPPFWKQFYDLECILNAQLQTLQPPKAISHTYNPVEYAAELHCAYLRKFLDGPKRLLFIGMNPGPNGMGQTGIPFGNVATVRDFMQLTGNVGQPPLVHPKRLVTGLKCHIEEPSGVRIWTLLQRLAAGSLTNFSMQCFVHNFCPLAFFDMAGKNITPSELKGEYKTKIRDICLQTLEAQISLLQPEIVVAVGDYVHTCLKKSAHIDIVRVLRLPHPSPRAINNQNWPEKAESMLETNDLIKYIRNEI